MQQLRHPAKGKLFKSQSEPFLGVQVTHILFEFIDQGISHAPRCRTTSRSFVGECFRGLTQPTRLTLYHGRFRPQNAIENREGGETVVTFDENLKTVNLRSTAGASGAEKDGFVFDRVFPMGTPQHELFDYGVKE